MTQFANPVGSGLHAERIDMGVDYGGSGNLFAMESGVVTQTQNSGWPGGTFIGIKLDSGQYVYYAEDIRPTVSVGQRVTAGQIVGVATGGSSGVEIGFAAPPGTGSTQAAATGQSQAGQQQRGDPGGFTTAYGLAMSNLIKALGGPAGIQQSGGIQGTVPASYLSGLPGSGAAVTPVNQAGGGGTSSAGGIPAFNCLMFVVLLPLWPILIPLLWGYHAVSNRVKRGWHIQSRECSHWESACQAHEQITGGSTSKAHRGLRQKRGDRVPETEAQQMNINDKIAVKVTNAVGTMWCAYIFTAISLTSLPSVISQHSINADVQWTAQTFLQLVLLSVIMVGQKVQSQQISELHVKHDRLHKHIFGSHHADAQPTAKSDNG